MILINLFLSLKSKYIIKGAIAQIEKKQGKLTCDSFGKPQHKKTKIKQKQNFSGETSFFQHNLNSGCKHITDNNCKLTSRVSSTLYKIFSLTARTFQKPYSSLAAFNLRIRNFVKFSVMERFLPFNLFLLLKTLRLSEYLANLTIMGQPLFSDVTPIR